MRTLSSRTSYVLVSVVGILCIIMFYLMIRIEGLETEGASMEKTHKEMKGKVIRELLSNMPGVYLEAEHHMRRGETRKFTLCIHGMSDPDEITTPPEVKVYKDGVELQVLRYPFQIQDSSFSNQTNRRLYRFSWRAEFGPGVYELWTNAGTNRISLQPSIEDGEARIKIGSLEFLGREVREAMNQVVDEKPNYLDEDERRVVPDNTTIVRVH